MKYFNYCFYVLCLFFVGCINIAESRECNQSVGKELFAEGKYDDSLYYLSECSDMPDVTEDTLGALILLYSWFGVGTFDSEKDRLRTIYKLGMLASIKGSEDGIKMMVELFRKGDAKAGVSSEKKRAECLLSDEGDKKLCFKGWEIEQQK